jgi:hypothetical protein
MPISRRSTYEIVDFNEGDNDDEKISYCKHCLFFGLKEPLKNRIYLEGQPSSDKDQFRQCHSCGTIYAIYELEKEATIKNVVETVENPFDIGKDSILGVDNRSSSTGKRKKRLKDKQKDLDDIKEADLKVELRKGHKLLSYSEDQPQ